MNIEGIPQFPLQETPKAETPEREISPKAGGGYLMCRKNLIKLQLNILNTI